MGEIGLNEQLRRQYHKPFEVFASTLRKDAAAIKAALALPWSNGQLEGQINKLKLLKRQMYGRANLKLLEHRLLCVA